MAMNKKQLKAIRRHKAIAKRRNIRTNNLPDTKIQPLFDVLKMSRTYRLYNI